MTSRAYPWTVLAQCTICEWQGPIEPKQLAYHVIDGFRGDTDHLNNDCPRCGARRLIDRSTPEGTA